MCGRYYIEQDYSVAELANIIAEAREKASAGGKTLTTGDVFPSNIAPVIARNRRLHKSVFAMKWGFSGKKGLVINARSETAAQRTMFRDSLRERRCVIPSSGYYEWRDGEKYGITTPQRVVFMAGLYRFEEEAAVFCILTTSPVESIAFIYDRMPLIIQESQVEPWLDGTFRIDEAASAAKPDIAYKRVSVC